MANAHTLGGIHPRNVLASGGQKSGLSLVGLNPGVSRDAPLGKGPPGRSLFLCPWNLGWLQHEGGVDVSLAKATVGGDRGPRRTQSNPKDLLG